MSRISPEEFFNKYVSTRQPCKFIDHISDADFKASSRWNLDYLKSNAGHNAIQVEQRATISDRFGKGSEHSITFGEFLERRDENLYMTTQELQYDTEDRPSIISPPLDALKPDFPWQPK